MESDPSNSRLFMAAILAEPLRNGPLKDAADHPGAPALAPGDRRFGSIRATRGSRRDRTASGPVFCGTHPAAAAYRAQRELSLTISSTTDSKMSLDSKFDVWCTIALLRMQRQQTGSPGSKLTSVLSTDIRIGFH